MDIHSCSRPDQVRVRHLDLDLDVHFDRRILEGSATLHFDRISADELILDTRELAIHSVEHAAGFELGAADPVLGAPLQIRAGARRRPRPRALLHLPGCVRPAMARSAADRRQAPSVPVHAIAGHSRAELDPAAGHARRARHLHRRHPHARPDCKAVMGAEMHDRPFPHGPADSVLPDRAGRGRPGLPARSARAPASMPSPRVVDAAAHEFADTEAMISTVEEMYGPYRWDRYDLLVLPPSFPFGGMENPRLTFATPTVLAGDRSLVSLVAHELAHSWSGNLVTNATWSDFWLNEGFTVYVERRVLERVYGGRARGHGGRARPPRAGSRNGRPARTRPRAAHRPHRPRSRRRLHAGPLRERRAAAAHHRARRRPRALRRLPALLLRPLRFPQHHHRRFPGVHPARTARPPSIWTSGSSAPAFRPAPPSPTPTPSPASKPVGPPIRAAGPRTSGCISCAPRKIPTCRAWSASSTSPSPAIPRSCINGC